MERLEFEIENKLFCVVLNDNSDTPFWFNFFSVQGDMTRSESEIHHYNNVKRKSIFKTYINLLWSEIEWCNKKSQDYRWQCKHYDRDTIIYKDHAFMTSKSSNVPFESGILLCPKKADISHLSYVSRRIRFIQLAKNRYLIIDFKSIMFLRISRLLICDLSNIVNHLTVFYKYPTPLVETMNHSVLVIPLGFSLIRSGSLL